MGGGMIEERADGKLEFQFNGKTTIVDPKQSAEAIRCLVQLIVALDQRVALEG